MSGEAPIQAGILRLSRGDVRLFRNQVGEGWSGRTVRNEDSIVLLEGARRITYGLFPGSGDMIGWRSFVITPDMVGQTFARFASVEAKGPTTAIGKGQAEWADAVRRAGGLAGIARSVDQARVILGVAP